MNTPESRKFLNLLKEVSSEEGDPIGNAGEKQERNLMDNAPIGKLPWARFTTQTHGVIRDGAATGGGNPVGLFRNQFIHLDGWAVADLFSQVEDGDDYAD